MTRAVAVVFLVFGCAGQSRSGDGVEIGGTIVRFSGLQNECALIVRAPTQSLIGVSALVEGDGAPLGFSVSSSAVPDGEARIVVNLTERVSASEIILSVAAGGEYLEPSSAAALCTVAEAP